MTPRERAEALGWKPSYGSWRAVRLIDEPVWPVNAERPGKDGRRTFYVSLAAFGGTYPASFGTESEALAAALELRDVVLS